MIQDIYNLDKKIEQTLNLIKKAPASQKELDVIIKKGITKRKSLPIIPNKKNKEIVEKFKEDLISQGLSKSRVLKHLYNFYMLSQMTNKEFKGATKEDVKEIIIKIEQCNNAPETKKGYKVTLKKLYKFLRGTEDYPEEVKWIKASNGKNNHKLPEDLLTEEDIKKLIDSTDTLQEKAFIFVLYEGGCRIGEVLSLKVKNVKFDEYGAVLLVDGKTGQRRVRVVSSSPCLREYINSHPQKSISEAPLWLHRLRNNAFVYDDVKHILHKLGKRAKINKPVNPHNFRHSRATYLANRITEAQMKEFFGWVQSSDMASVYVHLSGRDVDKAILNTYGFEINDKQKEESKLKPKPCTRCQEVNEATNKFCKRCGTVLDKEKADEIFTSELDRKQVDGWMDELVKDKEFWNMLITKIQEMGLKKIVS